MQVWKSREEADAAISQEQREAGWYPCYLAPGKWTLGCLPVILIFPAPLARQPEVEPTDDRTTKS